MIKSIVKHLKETHGLKEYAFLQTPQYVDEIIDLYFKNDDYDIIEQFTVYNSNDIYSNNDPCVIIESLTHNDVEMLYIYENDDYNKNIDGFLLNFPIFVSINREKEINEILNT
tara:strand:- start:288 stop:626 length:339 start_codon:yes stop_codon:yes gene_type:complete